MKVSEGRWREAQKKEANFWIKDVFTTQMARVKNRYAHSVSQIECSMNSDTHILEVGSGPTCLAQFFKKGYKVYLDPLMTLFKQYHSEYLPKGGLLVKGIGETLPFRNTCFEIVVSVNALDHMHDPEKVIDEIFRILRSGGHFLLGIFTHHSLLVLLRKLAEKLAIFREAAHPHSFTKEGILELLTKKGFKIISENCVYGKESLFSIHRRDYIIICRKSSP